LLLPIMFDMAIAIFLVLTKSNICGKNNLDVAVLLVLTKSNICGNSKVAVTVILQHPLYCYHLCLIW
jgi:hypothetical protein